MALGEIPPWLNVTPGLFTSAMESGARTGLQLADLQQRQMEAGSGEELARQKLASSISEAALDRASQQALAKRAQEISQNKFDVNTGLAQIDQMLRASAIASQNQARAANETKQSAAALLASTNDKAVAAALQYKNDNPQASPEEVAAAVPGLLNGREGQNFYNDLLKEKLARKAAGGITMTANFPGEGGRGKDDTIRGNPDDVQAYIKAHIPPKKVIPDKPSFTDYLLNTAKSGLASAEGVGGSVANYLKQNKANYDASHKDEEDFLRTIAARQAIAAATNSPATSASTPFLTNLLQQDAATNRPALGGYKIGGVYRGLKYLGGDPNDQSNWQPVK